MPEADAGLAMHAAFDGAAMVLGFIHPGQQLQVDVPHLPHIENSDDSTHVQALPSLVLEARKVS